MPPQGGRKHPHQEFMQIDTTNVLFIVGGAFAGLETVIEQRIGRSKLGFTHDMFDDDSGRPEVEGSLFGQVMPEDLLRFGLIPEFIGRLPVITAVEPLDQEALLAVLTEPKNALIKQYARLFELDGVELEFEQEALLAVADKAIARGTGARGLRAILEEELLEVMYDLPSRKDIAKVVVNADTIAGGEPVIVPREITPRRRRSGGGTSGSEKSA